MEPGAGQLAARLVDWLHAHLPGTASRLADPPRPHLRDSYPRTRLRRISLRSSCESRTGCRESVHSTWPRFRARAVVSSGKRLARLLAQSRRFGLAAASAVDTAGGISRR